MHKVRRTKTIAIARRSRTKSCRRFSSVGARESANSDDTINAHSDRTRKSSTADEELAGERAQRNKEEVKKKRCSADGCTK